MLAPPVERMPPRPGLVTRPNWDGSPGTLTGRIITETLRLYPPGWFLTRTVTRDTELAGQPLAVGW